MASQTDESLFKSMPRSSSRLHRPRPIGRWVPLLLAGTFLGVAGTAASQQGPAPAAAAAEPSPPVFGEALDVQLVNLEVYVSDKKGRPVEGLTADDFTVYENGRPVEITHFSVVEAGSPGAGGEPRPGGVAGERGGADDTPGVYLVAYIDNQNLLPGSRKRVLDDLETFLVARAEAGDGVMVVTHDNGALNLRQNLTGDPDAIRAALAEIRVLPAWGISSTSERRTTLNAIRQVFRLYAGLCDPCSCAVGEMESLARQYAQLVEGRVAVALTNLAYVAGALGGLPGRKAVLYAGDGLQQMAGLDVFHYLGELCPAQQHVFARHHYQYNAGERLRRVSERANANRVTFYALEAAGLRGFSAASVDFDDRRFTPSATNDRIRISNLQAPLYALADETGGRSVLNANRFGDELERVARELDNYYSLAYVPTSRGEGASHQIRVAVKNRSHRVRSRRSYRDKPPAEKLAERTLGTLIFGAEENPLGATLSIAAQEPAAEGEGYRVRLRVTVPGERLAVLDRGPAIEGHLRLVVSAQLEGETALPLRQKEVRLTWSDGRLTAVEEAAPETGLTLGETVAAEAAGALAPEAATAAAITVLQDAADPVFDVGFTFPAGRHKVAVAIRDEIAATTSYLRQPIELGTPTAPGR